MHPKFSFGLALEQCFLLMCRTLQWSPVCHRAALLWQDTRPSLPELELPAYTRGVWGVGVGIGGRGEEGLALPERASLQYEPVGAVLVLSSRQKLCHTLHRRGLGGRGCAGAFSWQSYPWTSLCSPSNRERGLAVHTAKCAKGQPLNSLHWHIQTKQPQPHLILLSITAEILKYLRQKTDSWKRPYHLM